MSLDEFLAGPMGKKTPEKARAFFATIDKNHTGLITLDQFVFAEAEREGELVPAKPVAPAATTNLSRPATPTPSPLVIVTGVVLEASDKGLLVQAAWGSLVWLDDAQAKVKMNVEISAVRTAPHAYTANGKTQMIEGYRASMDGR